MLKLSWRRDVVTAAEWTERYKHDCQPFDAREHETRAAMSKLADFLIQMGNKLVKVQQLSITDDNWSRVKVSDYTALFVVVIDRSLELSICQEMHLHRSANMHVKMCENRHPI